MVRSKKSLGEPVPAKQYLDSSNSESFKKTKFSSLLNIFPYPVKICPPPLSDSGAGPYSMLLNISATDGKVVLFPDSIYKSNHAQFLKDKCVRFCNESKE